MSTKTIKVDYLARVEGEGALDIRIRDNELEDVKLRIFEPPRFFEAFCAVVIFARHRILPRVSAASVRLPIS